MKTNAFHILFFMESRKVGFGLWLYMTAIWLLFVGKIDAGLCGTWVFLATGLIGGGTVLDRFIGKDKAAGNVPVAPQP